MSNCYCLEFSFASLSEYELTYNNCTGGTVTETFLSGVTYNICSQDFNPITSCLDINFEVKGLCVDGTCPGETLKYQNECNVLTIFPMGVQCFVDQPTHPGSTDGTVSLLITGGTPPYYINWENGSHSQTITNLGVGEYSATVIDYYGDFTANTICVLTGDTPTPSVTPTPTPTPIPAFPDLCLVIKGRFGKVSLLEVIDFTFNGYYGGKPSWISSDTFKLIRWDSINNQWEITGLPYTLVNLNPAVPPLTGWNTIGVTLPYQIQSISLTEGNCGTQDILRYNLTINQPTCGCDGSIVFDIIDGVPPYQYSINGVNYFNNQPIFQNLCGGIYSTSVIDSSGQTFNQTATLNFPPPNQTYVITLTLNNIGNTFNVSVTPSLPVGSSVTFDLVHVSDFTVSPVFSAYTYNDNVVVNVNGSPISVTSQSTQNIQTLLGKGCNNFAIPNPTSTNSVTTKTWGNITMIQGTTVNGTINNVTTLNPLLDPDTPCLSEKHSYTLNLNNVEINGCECCDVAIVNPPLVL
jgi:hypothetical protein